MFTRMNFELKVGIFIFIGLVILSVIVFSIGNFYTVKRGYNLNVIFSFANGISVGAPVRYSGVEVGEVKDIEVYFDEKENRPLVKILVWVEQNTWINEDAKANINTLGLLGEKYVEITPGMRDSRLLKKGEALRGQDPVSTEEITRVTKDLVSKVDLLIESINRIAGDEELRTSIKNTISNLETLSLDMKDFVKEIRGGKGTLGRLVSDDTLYRDADEMILEIKNNPWKLLFKPKGTGKTDKEDKKKGENK